MLRKGDLAVVALEGDVAGVRFGEAGHFAELTFRHALVEVVAAQNVLEVFHAIDFVEAFLGAEDEADMVPLAGGFGGVEGLAGSGVDGWLVESVEPAAALGVGGFGVVFELDFGAGGPGGAAVVGDAIHEAAVAAFGDIVVELDLEPREFVGGDDVAGVMRIDAGERAVLDLPAGADAFFFEIVPAIERGAVEEQPPAGGFLGGGEGVGGGFAKGSSGGRCGWCGVGRRARAGWRGRG